MIAALSLLSLLLYITSGLVVSNILLSSDHEVRTLVGFVTIWPVFVIIKTYRGIRWLLGSVVIAFQNI